MAVLYKFQDVDGDLIAVFSAVIPGHGPGVNIRTTRMGASIPVANIPELIDALRGAASEPGLDEGVRRLKLAARGRREYAKTADSGAKKALEYAAEKYEDAAKILVDLERLKDLLPVSMWGEIEKGEA